MNLEIGAKIKQLRLARGMGLWLNHTAPPLEKSSQDHITAVKFLENF